MSASRELQRQLRRIDPCLPRPATTPPAGPGWIHEIKHDGFRILAESAGKLGEKTSLTWIHPQPKIG